MKSSLSAFADIGHSQKSLALLKIAGDIIADLSKNVYKYVPQVDDQFVELQIQKHI